jgi:hypothetical protein
MIRLCFETFPTTESFLKGCCRYHPAIVFILIQEGCDYLKYMLILPTVF